MTEVDILRRQSTKTWAWFEETIADVTAEQANWWPPGTANSIGATYLHAPVEWALLRDYGRMVHAAFIDSLAEVTPALLDQLVDMTRSGLGLWQGRDLLGLHGPNHPSIHGGEIAVLKGLQGGIGWNEPEAFSQIDEFDG